MMLSALSVACALVLGAGPQLFPAAPSIPLPRSSIAAVLAHRGELGLGEAQVTQLEQRDAALQEQIAELRQRFAATRSRREGGWKRTEPRSSTSADDPAPPISPTASALPEGASGDGHRGGGTGRRGNKKLRK